MNELMAITKHIDLQSELLQPLMNNLLLPLLEFQIRINYIIFIYSKFFVL